VFSASRPNVDSFDRQEIIGGPLVVTPPYLPRYYPSFASTIFIAAVSRVYLGLVSVQAVGDLHLHVSYALSDGDAASLKRSMPG
jgi:hypothetical protein